MNKGETQMLLVPDPHLGACRLDAQPAVALPQHAPADREHLSLSRPGGRGGASSNVGGGEWGAGTGSRAPFGYKVATPRICSAGYFWAHAHSGRIGSLREPSSHLISCQQPSPVEVQLVRFYVFPHAFHPLTTARPLHVRH